MSTYEIYRRKARACLREAKKTRDPSELVVMLGIAHDYLILADHVWRRHDLDAAHKADEGSKRGAPGAEVPRSPPRGAGCIGTGDRVRGLHAVT